MERTEIKKTRTMSILQIAATDKENLTTKNNKKKMSATKTNVTTSKKVKKSCDPLDNKVTTLIMNNLNKNKTDQSTQSDSVLASDLTVDNPSEQYWQKLAESCKRALDTTLKENVDLHNRVNELEYEVSRLKGMLDEARSLVEVLTEMIEEKNEETRENEQDISILDESKENSDSELDETSFQSCT